MLSVSSLIRLCKFSSLVSSFAYEILRVGANAKNRSGRFILLKLWSPSKDQNIDIQSIVIHGFAGPRFFPATQLM